MKSKKTPERTVSRDINILLEKGVFEGVFPCAAAGVSLGVGKEKRKISTCFGNSSLYPEKRKLKKKHIF